MSQQSSMREAFLCTTVWTGQQVKQVRQAKLLTYENVTSPHATTTTNVYYVTNEFSPHIKTSRQQTSSKQRCLPVLHHVS